MSTPGRNASGGSRQSGPGRPASWWRDPMAYVTTRRRAEEVARMVAGAQRGGVSADAGGVFGTRGLRLAADLIYAAALGERSITTCRQWTRDAGAVEAAVGILRAHGEHLAAHEVESEMLAPLKQRAGVLATAAEIVGALQAPAVIAPMGPGRGELDPLDVSAWPEDAA